MAQLPDNACVLKDARIAYPNLVEPAPDLNGIDKYSCVLLIPKDRDLDKIKAALKEAIETGKKKKWGGEEPADLKIAVQDGDSYAAAAPEKPRDHYKGHYYINAKQDPEWGKPTVVDIHGVKSESIGAILSGDYVDAVIEFYPWRTAAGDGVSATPKLVHKIRNGEPIGGGVSPSAAMEALGLDPDTVEQGSSVVNENLDDLF